MPLSSFKKIDATDSEWPACKHVFTKYLNSQLIKSSPSKLPDLIWSDCQWHNNSPNKNIAKSMTKNQCINYFPEASEIFRKDILNDNILKMENKFPNHFEQILPKSWSLPEEYEKFKRDEKQISEKQYFIVKPNDEQRGCGIFITSDTENDLTPKSNCVVSKYVGNPLLIEGYKTDLRIHVLIASLDPLTVYVHKEGYLRLATCKYQEPNKNNSKNQFMHLTNWSVNKNNSESNFEDSGTDFSREQSENKLLRSLTFFDEVLGEKLDASEKVTKTKTQIYEDINRIIFKTILASYNDLKKEYQNSFGPITKQQNYKNNASRAFQLLGYDIMLDENFKPWFIEINHNPDLDDEPFMAGKTCRKLISDTVDVIGHINGFECSKNRDGYLDEYTEVYDLPDFFEKLDLDKYFEEIGLEFADRYVFGLDLN